MQTVTDQGTASYNSLKPDLDAVRKVGSVLYRPPHSECSCGYIFGVGKTAMRNAQAQLNSGSEEIDKLKRIIEVEESLGRDRKAVWGLSRARGGSDGWRMDWIGKRDPCSEYEIAMFEHTAMEFVDFCVLKAEIRPELASDRKVVSNASDPELTLWDLYGYDHNLSYSETSLKRTLDQLLKAF